MANKKQQCSVLDLFDNSVSCRTSLAFSRSMPCENAVFKGICSETEGFRTTLFFS